MKDTKKKEELEAEREEARSAAREAKLESAREDQDFRVKGALQALREDASQDGHGFGTFHGFLAAVFSSKDQTVSSTWSRYCRNHGAEMMDQVRSRAPEVANDWMMSRLLPVIQKEGRRIKEIMSHGRDLPLIQLVEEFSLDKLADEIQEKAPVIWSILCDASGGDTGGEDGEVLTTMCAMMGVLRSQRANDFQTTFGLFLLASGSAKREIEVLSHAGLCTSYSTILEHVKGLSDEGAARFRELIKKQACMIAWDNLNIAFRKDAQRLSSADHFDNGTTATLVPLYDPVTGSSVPHGALPFSLNEPRTTRKLDIPYAPADLFPTRLEEGQISESCLWQLKRLAMDHIPGLSRLQETVGACPTVDQIPLHKTEQYPLPAMETDESSIDGTLEVVHEIFESLGMTSEDWRKHGLLFVDGDLLTMQLVDKLQSARRNSTDDVDALRFLIQRFGLFHSQMAAGRMVVNEHWGKPNSPWPGSLWWSNTQLKRKKMAAGWKGRKATPWKQAHELINITLPAHVKDAFRIHCGAESLEHWAARVSASGFDKVARIVLAESFSTSVVENLRRQPDALRDHAHENTLLFNRDALFYVEYNHAIKAGDIGRVVNILRVWAIMMRGVGAMPKYADVIFETLGRLRRYPPRLRQLFLHNWLVNLSGKENGHKPVDMMQEHQNLWAKVVYNAKGSNKTWRWLSRITVCIFILRDTMRKVQSAYGIPSYGERHTVPDITNEVQLLADLLEEEKLQTYVKDRPGNEHVTPVRDLMGVGVAYFSSANAYQNFRVDKRVAVNAGPAAEAPVVDVAGEVVDESDEEVEGTQEPVEEVADDGAGDGPEREDYSDVHAVGPSFEDLVGDDEELFEYADQFLDTSMMMIEDLELLTSMGGPASPAE
ncbi:hypothetical protein GGG16DRAFT_63723 [Schizophyllum commune]